DAGGTEDDDKPGPPLRVINPRTRAPDRLRDRLDRDVLADHPLVELVLHPQELLGLNLGQLEDRDPRPHRDDVRDLLLANLGPVAALTALPLILELVLAVGELALLVTQVRGLLELLRLDRRLLRRPRLLDLLLELA